MGLGRWPDPRGALLELVAASNPSGSASLARINADNNLLEGRAKASHLDAVYFSTSGLAVFGGWLRSTNYVVGVSGWRLTAACNAGLKKLVARDSIVVGAASDTRAASKLPEFNNTPSNTGQLVLTPDATGPQDFVMISCAPEFLTKGNASFSMRFSLEGYDGAIWTVPGQGRDQWQHLLALHVAGGDPGRWL